MSTTFPLYYGQAVVLQAYSYGPGWLGATPGFVSVCGNNGPFTIPDIYTQAYAYGSSGLYNQGEPFYVLNSSGQTPTGGQTPVAYNDTITLQQVSTGKLWTIIPKCHDDSGIAIGATDGSTASYTLIPTSSSNSNANISAAVESAPSSTAANGFYLQSVQEPKSYVYSDPNGNGVLLGSGTKTYFQFFLVSAPPSPTPQCSATVSCPTGYQCNSSGTCVIIPPQTTCTGPGTCPTNFTCIKSTCQPNCVTTSTCPQGTICTNGVCQTPACSDNADCPTNYVCQGNTCIPIAGCQTSATCNQGWSCVQNVCVPPAPQCSSTQKCSFGKSCTNGVCEFNYIFPAIGLGAVILIVIIIVVAANLSSKKKK